MVGNQRRLCLRQLSIDSDALLFSFSFPRGEENGDLNDDPHVDVGRLTLGEIVLELAKGLALGAW